MLEPLSLISAGRFTYFDRAPEVLAWSGEARVMLGQWCSVARGVRFLLSADHRTEWVTTYPPPREWVTPEVFGRHPRTKGDILVGNDVWISAYASLFSGITVGDGAVVAGGAVVVKDVPPYAIVAGNPARVIKRRFSECQVAELLAIRWWDWPVEKVQANANLIWSDDLTRFIETHRL